MDCSPPDFSVHEEGILHGRGFSRQGDWSGLPGPPPRDIPNQGSNSYASCIGRRKKERERKTEGKKGREEREREEGKSLTGRMFFASRPLFGGST